MLATAIQQSWLTAPARPLDAGGPTCPFTHLPDDFTDRPAFATFRAVAEQRPEKLAIVDVHDVMTYGELLAAATSVAHELLATTQPGEAVGILMPSSASFAVAVLACLAAGRPYVALDARYPAQRNRSVIDQAGLGLLIVDNRLTGAERLHTGDLQLLDLAAMACHDDGPPDFALLPSVSTDDPAIILFTSGSTGTPKGIVNSQRSVLLRVYQNVEASHLGCDDAFLLLSSFCTIAGTRDTMSALLVGARVVVVDAEKAGLRAIRRLLRAQAITIAYSLPALMGALIAADDSTDDFRTLRVVRLGGDRVLAHDIAVVRGALPAHCHIQAGYSSTEITGTQWFVPPDWIARSASAPVGYMMSDVTFAIVDDDGLPVDDGEIGELIMRSRYVALGQWQNGRCVPGGGTVDASDPRMRIFPTGDLVRMEQDGLIEVIGRKDRQIKINGKRVEPAELETLLRRYPGVLEAAVVARRLDGQTFLVAFVVPVAGAAADLPARLDAAIRASLPGVLHPSRLHLLPVLPRLPSAKLDVPALHDADEMLQRQADIQREPAAPARPSQETQAVIERIWGRLLRGERVRPNRTWEQAGGDSLKLIRFVFEVEKAIGRDLPLDRFAMNMTPADFAGTIDHCLAPAPQAADADDRPTVYFLPGLSADTPGLASLRADLRPSVRIVPIAYDDWRVMAETNCSIESLAEVVLAQIIEDSPTGTIHLASYSFGGAVALVVAQRLGELGRKVGLFAVLDTNIGAAANHVGQGRMPTLHEIRRGLTGVMRGEVSLVGRACQLFARALVAPSRGPLLRRLARTPMSRLPNAVQFAMQKELDEALRWQAYQRWVREGHPIWLDGRMVLFRSQQDRAGAPRDLGWGMHFAGVDIVASSGDHHAMLRAPHRSVLGSNFIERLRIATKQAAFALLAQGSYCYF